MAEPGFSATRLHLHDTSAGAAAANMVVRPAGSYTS
jgi:hypothetical protein